MEWSAYAAERRLIAGVGQLCWDGLSMRGDKILWTVIVASIAIPAFVTIQRREMGPRAPDVVDARVRDLYKNSRTDTLSMDAKIVANPLAMGAVRQGGIQLEQGRLAEAELSYKEASRLDPLSASIFAALGVTQQFQGKLEAAQESYKHALDLDSHDVGALLGEASLHHARKEYAAAIAGFASLREAHPELPQAIWGLAICYMETGRSDEAKELFSLYLQGKTEPRNAEFARSQLTR